MKKIILSIIASASIFAATSCSDMLGVDNARQVENPALDQKTDSVFYAYGIMQAMQQLADQYFFQNEMRGDLVKPTSKASVHLQALSNYTAGTDCKYDSVYLYYKVINNCNYYLANRDTTLATGNQNVVMNEYTAIAAFRAWAYLQLAYQYGNVPYVTEPVLYISQINSIKEKTDYRQILASQAEYLQALKDRVTEDQLDVPFYKETVEVGETQWGVKKTITPSKCFVPFNVVLGDLYLALGEYKKAALAYFDYLRHTAEVKGQSAIGIGYASPRMKTDTDGHNFYMEYPADYNLDKNNSIYSSLGPWTSEYGSLQHPAVISYIPMAVDYTKGKTTEIPSAFGYDYYATSGKTITALTKCPQTEEVQVVPSEAYTDIADNTQYYYYTEQQVAPPYRWKLSEAKLGDARSNEVVRGSGNYSDLVFVLKPSTGTVLLYRNITVFMHLAEAFNRMGYPELAFAIMKTGLQPNIKSYLTSEYVPGSGIEEDNYYIPVEAYQMLETEIPFFSEANKELFTNQSSTIIIGTHLRGAGAVDDLNSPYQYKKIVEARIEKIRSDFNLGLGGQAYSKEEYINAVEDLLCDEYAMEFAFEGTRYSDLLRIARHKNMAGTFSSTFGDTWLSKKLESKAPGITTQNCYLPFQ
ncbi:MAG: hypothetical protein MSA13_04735 [Prevotella sp.]|nr:hypothetical protein [Prevotella sp.]